MRENTDLLQMLTERLKEVISCVSFLMEFKSLSMQEVSTFNGSDSIFTPMTTQIRSGKVSFLRE